jgi:hypothetical protein
MNSDGSNIEGLSLKYAGDLELEGDFARGMSEQTTVGEKDFEWRTWLSGKIQGSNYRFVNEVKRRA